jgi:hypothetical protein
MGRATAIDCGQDDEEVEPTSECSVWRRCNDPLLSRLIPGRVAFAAVEEIATVQSPLLVLHSPDDEIEPIQRGRR